MTNLTIAFFFLLLLLHHRTCSGDPCSGDLLPQPHQLHPTKLTVLLSGYSEARLPLLRRLAIAYSSHPLVSSVQIIWSNPSTPAAALRRHLLPFPTHRPSTPSLNARFLPRPSVLTRAVAVADDDVLVPPAALSFALSLFHSDPARAVGFFPRSHDLDLAARRWIYTLHPDRYSLVLTKFVVLHARYLRDYSCAGGARMRASRAMVDRVRNCEDILMNFVVADAAGAGPLLVDAGGVRDWGDVRNDGGGGGNGSSSGVANHTAAVNGGDTTAGVGLSRREGHWRTRGGCIGELHKIWGRMPLKYSYGKVSKGVGEQALCVRAGHLLPCDA